MLMPLLLIIFLAWLFWPQGKRKRKTTIKYTVSDPVKVQREQIRLAEQYRKAEEREQKAIKQEKKRTEARQAAQDEINWIMSYIDSLSAMYDRIENELENNPSLKEVKRIQLEKQLLQTEEKIHKYKVKLDKAYFTANN